MKGSGLEESLEKAYYVPNVISGMTSQEHCVCITVEACK